MELIFLRLNHVDEAVARVRKGGHDIPVETIRRRFASDLANFHAHYAPAVDCWALHDNAGAAPVLLDWSEQ